MGIIKMKNQGCHKNEIAALNYARNDTRSKQGFTLIEMLTTTAILVVVFGLLAIIFGRATTIHKVVRSGGDAENFGIYLMNTIIYGHGINREEALVGAQPFNFSANIDTDTLIFQDQNNQEVQFIMDGSSIKHKVGTTYVDLKPTWATDRQLEVLPDSRFYYYKDSTGAETATGTNPVYVVGIKLVLKNTLQNISEQVTLYRCVRIRNQIDF